MPILGIVQLAIMNVLTQNVSGILKSGHLVDFLDILHDVQPTLGAATETDFESQFDINLVRDTVKSQYATRIASVSALDSESRATSM